MGLSARSKGFSQKRMTVPIAAPQNKQALTEQIPRIQINGSARDLQSARGSRNEAVHFNLALSSSSLKTSTQTVQQHPLASQKPPDRFTHNQTSPYLQNVNLDFDLKQKPQNKGNHNSGDAPKTDWVRIYQGRKTTTQAQTDVASETNTVQNKEQPKKRNHKIKCLTQIKMAGELSSSSHPSNLNLQTYHTAQKSNNQEVTLSRQHPKISSLNRKYSYATIQEREESHDRIQKIYNIKSPNSYENLHLFESNSKIENLAKLSNQGISPRKQLTKQCNQALSPTHKHEERRTVTQTDMPSAVILKTASQRNLQNNAGLQTNPKETASKAVNSIQQPLVSKSALSASQKKFLTLLNQEGGSKSGSRAFELSKDNIIEQKKQQNIVKTLRKNAQEKPMPEQKKKIQIGQLTTRLKKVVSSDMKCDNLTSARNQVYFKKATSPTPFSKQEKKRQASTSIEKKKMNSYRPSTQLLMVNTHSQKALKQVKSPTYQRNRPLLQSKFLAQTASTQNLANQQSQPQKSMLMRLKNDKKANVTHLESHRLKNKEKSQNQSSNTRAEESASEVAITKKRDVSDTVNARKTLGLFQFSTKKGSSDLLKKNQHLVGLAKVRNNYLNLKSGLSIQDKIGANKSIIAKRNTSQTSIQALKSYSATNKTQKYEQLNSVASLANASRSQNQNKKQKVDKKVVSPERVLKSHKTDAYYDLQNKQVNFQNTSDQLTFEKNKEKPKRLVAPLQSEYLKVENKCFNKTKSQAKIGIETFDRFKSSMENVYAQQEKNYAKIMSLQRSADGKIGKKVRQPQNMLGIKRHSERKTPKTVLLQTHFRQTEGSSQQQYLSRKFSQDTFNNIEKGRSLSQLDLQKPLSPAGKITHHSQEDTWQSGCSVDDQNELLSPNQKSQNSARNLPSSSTRGPKALLMKTEQAASQKSIRALAQSPQNPVKRDQKAQIEENIQQNYWRLSNCPALCQSHNSVSPVISQPTDQQGVLYIQNNHFVDPPQKPIKKNLNEKLKLKTFRTDKKEAFGPKSGQIGHHLCYKPGSNETSMVVQANQITTQVDMFEEVPLSESMQNFSFSEMRSILISAVRKGDLDKVKLISLSYTKDFDLANSFEEQTNGKAAIHIASEVGNEAILEILVRKLGANVNLRDSLGFTSLHYACIQLHRNIIERLLLMKADANMPETLAGNTPLHLLAMVVGQQKYQEEATILIEILIPFAEESKGVQNKDGFFAWQLLPQQSFLVELTKPKAHDRVTSSEAYVTSESQSSDLVTASQVQGQAGQRNSATRNMQVQEISEQAAQRIFTFCEKPSSQQESSTESLNLLYQNSGANKVIIRPDRQQISKKDLIRVDENEVQDQYQLKGQQQKQLDYLDSDIALDNRTGEIDIKIQVPNNELESGPVHIFVQNSDEYSSQKRQDTQERNKTNETPGFEHLESLQNGKIGVPIVTDEHRLIYTSTETISSAGFEKPITPPVRLDCSTKQTTNFQNSKMALGSQNKQKIRSGTSLTELSQNSQRGGQTKFKTKSKKDQNQRYNQLISKVDQKNSRLMAAQKSPNQKVNLASDRSATTLAFSTDLRQKVDKQVSVLHNIIRRSKAQSQASTAKTNQHSLKSMESRKRIGPEDFVAHQLLGTGSFGEVFLVQRKTDNKLLAMKVLSKKKIREQNLKKYALTERNVMSVMGRHPFIVQLQSAFQTRDNLYLVSDYCPGGDLSQYLEIEGSFSEEKAKVYIEEILLGIEALHACDIIFRDLKPDNVIIDADGHAILTDFGLSREQVRRSESGAKSFCGSYAYLAPEMLEKKGHGKAVDWYLLGVILFEMVTGLPPYYADDKEELFQNIVKDHIDMQKVKREHNLSSNCADLLEKLLRKDPMKRIGTFKGASEVKEHAFFGGTDWSKVYKKQSEMPEPYLAKMAMDIIKQQPFLVAGHPQTVGEVCPRDHKNYFTRWSFVHKTDNNLKTLTKPKTGTNLNQ